MGTREAAVIIGRTLPSHLAILSTRATMEYRAPNLGSFVTALTPVASALRPSLRLLPA